jgi:predicted nucleic acid-binding Zn ribbon protein
MATSWLGLLCSAAIAESQDECTVSSKIQTENLQDRSAKNTLFWVGRLLVVSVLMALKAAVDFSVDLRNHDPDRTWDHGYVEN